MHSPYLIVAVASVGQRVDANGDIVVEAGVDPFAYPAPALSVADAYRSYVTSEANVRHTIKRHYVPLMG